MWRVELRDADGVLGSGVNYAVKRDADGNVINEGRAFTLTPLVANGTHQMYVRAYTVQGNLSVYTDSPTYTITVSGQVITVRMSYPTGGQLYAINPPATTAPLDVTGDADGNGAKIVKFEVLDGTAVIGTFAANNSGFANFSSRVNIGPGSHSIRLRATDNLGQQGVSTAAVVNVNPAPPIVTVTTPIANTTFGLDEGSSTATVPVKATAQANSPATLRSFEVLLDGVVKGSTISGNLNTWVRVSPGKHTLEIRARDSNLRETTKPIEIFVGSTSTQQPGSATLTLPAPGTYTGVNGTYSMRIAGSGTPSTFTTMKSLEVLDGSTVIWTGYGTSIDTMIPLAVGMHTLTLRANDNWGYSATSNPVTVVVASGPSARLDTPVADQKFTAVGGVSSVQFTGAAIPAGMTLVTKLELVEEGVAVPLITSSGLSFNEPRSLAVGMHKVMARATDEFGNVGESPLVAFEVIAPVVPLPTLTITRTPSTVVSGQNYTVNWASTDATSVAYNCTSTGTGLTTAESSLPANGSRSGTAMAAWVGYPTTCVWTATGPGGTATQSEVMTTLANGNNAQITAQNIPAAMTTGSSYDVTVTVKNVGNTYWTSLGDDQFTLVAVNEPIPLFWGVSKVYMPRQMGPGEEQTLSFRVTAPLPGVYDQQWQMSEQKTGNFGAISSRTVVVSAAAGQAPTLAVAEPIDQSTVATSGLSASVTVNATMTAFDGAAPRRIEVSENGVLIASVDAGSMDAAIELSGGGNHRIQIRAFDSLGRASAVVERVVSVTLNPPLTTMTAPVNFVNEYLNGVEPNVRVAGSAKASGNLTIKRIELYDGDTLLRSFDGGVIDTRMYFPKGVIYALRMRAVDSSEQVGAFTQIAHFTVLDPPVPKAALLATPNNVRVAAGQSATVSLIGSGSVSEGVLSKLEVFKDAGNGYEATPVKVVTGSSASLQLNEQIALPGGLYRFKSRSTSASNQIAESEGVLVNVTDSSLLGMVAGVRTTVANGIELYGWACEPAQAAALNVKVMLDAPTSASGGTQLTSALANVGTEPNASAVSSSCATPGVPHHFVIDLTPYLQTYAGRALYVAASRINGATDVTLQCEDSHCTMPGTQRIMLTTPLTGDRVPFPNPVFMRAQLSNFTGAADAVWFVVNGEQVNAVADAGFYSASKSGLPVKSEAYTVKAYARQGNLTVESVESSFYAIEPSAISMTSPANGASFTLGSNVSLGASFSGGTAQAVRLVISRSGAADITVAGTASGSTWTAQWAPAVAGVYTVVAKAYDAKDAVIAASTSVALTVTAPAVIEPGLVPVRITPPHIGNPVASTLPGQLGVSPGGAATYSIPLVVPPGTAGVVPQLSLDYSSDAQNGILGLGWSLGGQSMIHRCGQTIAQDGENNRIGFTNKDRLCLDGKRLVLANVGLSDDAYWANGAEYRTEIDSYSRVTMFNSGGNISFKVETKDGRVMTYGGGSATVQPVVADYMSGITAVKPSTRASARAWALARVTDRSGNFIDYSYTQDGTAQATGTGEHLLSEIAYGGNGKAAHAKVKVTYESRKDAWKRYVDDTRNDMRKRISAITTYVIDGSTEKVVRNYKFGYDYSPTSGRSMLTKITPCAGDREACEMATTFRFGKPAEGKTEGFEFAGEFTGAPVLTTARVTGDGTFTRNHADFFAFNDFDNDGKADVLEKRIAPMFDSMEKTETGYRKEAIPVGVKIGDMRGSYKFYHNEGGKFVPHDFVIKPRMDFVVLDVGDFNGDGALDLLVDRANGSGPKICLSPLVKPAGLTSTIEFDCDNSLAARGQNMASQAPVVMDLLGDGRSGIYTRYNLDKSEACQQTECKDDLDPPLQVVGATYGFDGSPELVTNQYNSLVQMVDFGGVGKPYDVRWSRMHWTEKKIIDGIEVVGDARWYNQTPEVWVNTATYPGKTRAGDVTGVRYAKLPDPPMLDADTPLVRVPYLFDAPSQSGGLSGDFNGTGYSSMAYGYLELSYDNLAAITYKKADFTVCLSTGRGLDCEVRKKYSNDGGNRNYRQIEAIANFVGDGMPSILTRTIVYPEAGEVHPSTDVEMCTLMGDVHPSQNGADPDENMVCKPWPGVKLLTNGKDAVDQTYFMDLLGTGRTQIVYYQNGYYDTGCNCQKDAKWLVYAPKDVAERGEALDRLVSVTNGLGLVSGVEYADGVASGIVTQSGSSELKYPQHVTAQLGKVVRKLTVGNGGDRVRTTTYTYQDAANDLSGRGSLGFAQVTATDVEMKIVTTSNYLQTWPYTGMLKSSMVTFGRQTLVETRNEEAVKTHLQPGGATTYFPHIAKTTVVRTDLNGAKLGQSVTENTYDVPDQPLFSDLVLQKVTSTGPDLGDFVTKVATTYSYTTSSSAWQVGLPTEVVTTRSAPGAAEKSRKLKREYDANGLLWKETIEPGNVQYEVVTEQIRNSFGLPKIVRQYWKDPSKSPAADGQRDVQTVSYDDNGRFAKQVTNAVGHTETSEYDAGSGARTSAIGPNNLTTNWTIDAFGRVTSERRADGTVTRPYTVRCSGGCLPDAVVAQVVDTLHADGAAETRTAAPHVTYADAAGHVLGTHTYGFDGAQITAENELDTLGRIKTQYRPRFDAVKIDAVSFTYDALNRIIEEARLDEAGQLNWVTNTDYDGLKMTVTRKDKGNSLLPAQVTVNERDVLGQLRQVTDANGGIVKFEYDVFGGLTKTTDPELNEVSIQYDALGRKTQLKDPDLGIIYYSVDPLGRTWKSVNPVEQNNSGATKFEFDNLDRMTRRLEPELDSHWVYDTATNGKGQLALAYTGTGGSNDYRREHRYDSLGRPLDTEQQVAGHTFLATAGYDAWGRASAQVYKHGQDKEKRYALRYNGYGQLATITKVDIGATGQTEAELWKGSKRDAHQRLVEALLGNGLKETHNYNAQTATLRGVTVETAAGGLIRVADDYQYNAFGNMDKRTQTWDIGRFEETFKYDLLNRVKESTLTTFPNGAPVSNGTPITYDYDKAGNMKHKSDVSAEDYVYPAQGALAVRPHAVQSIGGIVGSFTYDANGNMTAAPNGRAMTWYMFDMPKDMGKGAQSSFFVYGTEHQRIRQERKANNVLQTTVVYGGAQEVEVDKDNKVTVKTYWPQSLGVEIDKPDATQPVLYWTHADRLGSVMAMTDSVGAIQERTAFDVWGKRRDPVGLSTSDTIDGKIDNKGFTHHEMLDQLDLVHMNGRVYDPLIGRFISADPMIDAPYDGQAYSRYSYVNNNPTNLTDPTGFCVKETGSNICDKEKTAQDKAESAQVKWTQQFVKAATALGVSRSDALNFANRIISAAKEAGGEGKKDVNNNQKVDAKSAISGYVDAKAAIPTGQVNGCDPGMQCVVVPGQNFAITKNQRSYLAQGDFISFWQSRHLDSHDPVAKTALSGWAPQTLKSISVWKEWGAKFTWAVLRANLDGTEAEKDATMKQIGLDLARAHANSVDVDLRDKIGVPGLLSPNQVTNDHWDVFSKHGISPRVFGGTLGGLPASSYPVMWCEGCDGNKK